MCSGQSRYVDGNSCGLSTGLFHPGYQDHPEQGIFDKTPEDVKYLPKILILLICF